MSDNTKEIELHKTEMLLALRNNLSSTLHMMNLCIQLTPTGKDRNLLCDANLHLLSAKETIGQLYD